MVTSLQVFPSKFYIIFASLPCVLHVQPIFLTWSLGHPYRQAARCEG